jgi:hypothetical protein
MDPLNKIVFIVESGVKHQTNKQTNIKNVIIQYKELVNKGIKTIRDVLRKTEYIIHPLNVS